MTDIDPAPVHLSPQDAEEAVSDLPQSGDDFRTRIAAVAHHLDRMRGVTGRRGQLAKLRRIRGGADTIPPEVFWDLVTQFNVPEHEEGFWLRLLPLMAAHRHDGKVAPGLAFARAELTAARMERWLRADSDTAWCDAGRLLARVGDSGVDWVRLGLLLRFWTPELRRRTARDFFRSPEYLRRSSSSQGA